MTVAVALGTCAHCPISPLIVAAAAPAQFAAAKISVLIVGGSTVRSYVTFVDWPAAGKPSTQSPETATVDRENTPFAVSPVP